MTAIDYEDVLREVTSLIAERLAEPGRADGNSEGLPKLDETTRFELVGVDSIDLIVVLTHFEQAHGFTFENEEVDVELYPTLGDLAKTIARRLDG